MAASPPDGPLVPGAVVAQPASSPRHSHTRRNRALLEALRTSHPLELRGVPVPPAGQVRMADASGTNATCEFKPVTLDVRRQSLLGNNGADKAPETFQEALAPLAGSCAELNEGWWTYKWCHRNEIRQYHREPNGKVTQDWSLGKFVAAKSPDESLQGRRYHVHQFEDGQRCDETGKGRSTQVRFFCCDAQGDGFASIQSIDEPHLCRYSIVVCSLFTCVDETSTAKAPTFKRLLYPLTGVCFQRNENWWTYEFCFGHYVRQFHQEVVESADKKKTQTVVDPAYMLGRMPEKPAPPIDAPAVGGQQEDAFAELRRLISEYRVPEGGKPTELLFTSLHAHPEDPSQSYLLQRFINGSKCELTGANRTTDVKIFCAEAEHGDRPDQLVPHHVFGEVSEVSTCHYEVTFSTSLVCAHPAFQVAKVPDVNVECTPEDANGVPLPAPTPDIEKQRADARLFKRLSRQPEPGRTPPTRATPPPPPTRTAPPAPASHTSTSVNTPATSAGTTAAPTQPTARRDVDAPAPAPPAASMKVGADGAVTDARAPAGSDAAPALSAEELERMRQRHMDLSQDSQGGTGRESTSEGKRGSQRSKGGRGPFSRPQRRRTASSQRSGRSASRPSKPPPRGGKARRWGASKSRSATAPSDAAAADPHATQPAADQAAARDGGHGSSSGAGATSRTQRGAGGQRSRDAQSTAPRKKRTTQSQQE